MMNGQDSYLLAVFQRIGMACLGWLVVDYRKGFSMNSGIFVLLNTDVMIGLSCKGWEGL